MRSVGKRGAPQYGHPKAPREPAPVPVPFHLPVPGEEPLTSCILLMNLKETLPGCCIWVSACKDRGGCQPTATQCSGRGHDPALLPECAQAPRSHSAGGSAPPHTDPTPFFSSRHSPKVKARSLLPPGWPRTRDVLPPPPFPLHPSFSSSPPPSQPSSCCSQAAKEHLPPPAPGHFTARQDAAVTPRSQIPSSAQHWDPAGSAAAQT